jgi:hypothetical protein
MMNRSTSGIRNTDTVCPAYVFIDPNKASDPSPFSIFHSCAFLRFFSV